MWKFDVGWGIQAADIGGWVQTFATLHRFVVSVAGTMNAAISLIVVGYSTLSTAMIIIITSVALRMDLLLSALLKQSSVTRLQVSVHVFERMVHDYHNA